MNSKRRHLERARYVLVMGRFGSKKNQTQMKQKAKFEIKIPNLRLNGEVSHDQKPMMTYPWS